MTEIKDRPLEFDGNFVATSADELERHQDEVERQMIESGFKPVVPEIKTPQPPQYESEKIEDLFKVPSRGRRDIDG